MLASELYSDTYICDLFSTVNHIESVIGDSSMDDPFTKIVVTF